MHISCFKKFENYEGMRRVVNYQCQEILVSAGTAESAGTTEQGRLGTHFLVTNDFMFVGNVLKMISTS